MTDKRLAWHALRLTLGLNILLHGLTRLPTLSAFAAGMAKQFSDTPLPEPLVVAFGYVLPVLEAVLGTALLSGKKARYSLLAGMALMAVLQFGTALRSDWATLSLQLGYSVVYFILLYTNQEE